MTRPHTSPASGNMASPTLNKVVGQEHTPRSSSCVRTPSHGWSSSHPADTTHSHTTRETPTAWQTASARSTRLFIFLKILPVRKLLISVCAKADWCPCLFLCSVSLSYSDSLDDDEDEEEEEEGESGDLLVVLAIAVVLYLDIVLDCFQRVSVLSQIINFSS
ncbi:hypothetical protein Pelo_19085 [Pelomyxa schiedti]|nr:hypothetical protein Pelo_19085 [Pelomyxa schiedti]